MNTLEIIMWLLIPILAYSCYRWGFQSGAECTIDYLQEIGKLELDEEPQS